MKTLNENNFLDGKWINYGRYVSYRYKKRSNALLQPLLTLNLTL